MMGPELHSSLVITDLRAAADVTQFKCHFNKNKQTRNGPLQTKPRPIERRTDKVNVVIRLLRINVNKKRQQTLWALDFLIELISAHSGGKYFMGHMPHVSHRVAGIVGPGTW